MIPAHNSGATPCQIEIRRNLEHEALRDNNAVGVATIRHATGVLVREVVRQCEVRAELLHTRLALRARAVGVHQASHRGEIARLELRHRGSDLGHAANNLVARERRDTPSASLRSTHCEPGEDPNGRCRRKVSQSGRRVRWARAAQSWWKKMAMSRWRRNKLLPCT